MTLRPERRQRAVPQPQRGIEVELVGELARKPRAASSCRTALPLLSLPMADPRPALLMVRGLGRIPRRPCRGAVYAAWCISAASLDLQDGGDAHAARGADGDEPAAVAAATAAWPGWPRCARPSPRTDARTAIEEPCTLSLRAVDRAQRLRPAEHAPCSRRGLPRLSASPAPARRTPRGSRRSRSPAACSPARSSILETAMVGAISRPSPPTKSLAAACE